MTRRKWFGILLLLFLLAVGGLAGLSMFAKKPDNLGVHAGKLAPCPETPNCVSTRATDAEHAIEPLRFEGSSEEALARLRRALASEPRLSIVIDKDGYIHAEAVSLLLRFVDDVEFLVDADAKEIHFRSASRVGRSDLGANRARMERIRAAFTQ